MQSYFEGFEHEDAELIESYSRLVYELRENRNQLLSIYGVDNDTAILDKILNGEITEHPAYEHYLSAKNLAEVKEEIRAELRAILQEVRLA